MKTVTVRLNLMETVGPFYKIISRYPYDIDLRAGRDVVDAKSTLGLIYFFSKHNGPVTLEIYSDEPEELLEEIRPFMVQE